MFILSIWLIIQIAYGQYALSQILQETNIAYCTDMAKDGSMVVSGIKSGQLKIYTKGADNNFTLSQTFTDHTAGNYPRGVAISTNKNAIVVGGTDSTIKIYTLSASVYSLSQSITSNSPFLDIAVSSDAHNFAAVDANNVLIYNLTGSTYTMVHNFTYGANAPKGVGLSLDGTSVAHGGSNSVLTVQDLVSGVWVTTISITTTSPIQTVRISSDGLIVVYGTTNGKVFIYKRTSKSTGFSLFQNVLPNSVLVRSVSLSDDSKWLMVGTSDASSTAFAYEYRANLSYHLVQSFSKQSVSTSANKYMVSVSSKATYFSIGSQNNKTLIYQQCSVLMTNCLYCNSSTYCTKCKDGYYYSNSSCTLCSTLINYCTNCTSTSLCTSCKTGYVLTGSVCTLCSQAVVGCTNCSSDTSCQTCKEGYFVTKYGQCRSCSDSVGNCRQCSNASVCQLCYPQYILESGRQCRKCNYYILNCENCSSTKICTACTPGYNLNNNQCVLEFTPDVILQAQTQNSTQSGMVLGIIETIMLLAVMILGILTVRQLTKGIIVVREGKPESQSLKTQEKKNIENSQINFIEHSVDEHIVGGI